MMLCITYVCTSVFYFNKSKLGSYLAQVFFIHLDEVFLLDSAFYVTLPKVTWLVYTPLTVPEDAILLLTC